MSKDLEVLQHAIGADRYGNIVHGGDRNYFITGEGSKDFAACVDCVTRGLMTRSVGNAITGGDDIFCVTRAGRQYVRDNSLVAPPAPKLTAGQRRYQEWLQEDGCIAFGEWLKWKSRKAA